VFAPRFHFVSLETSNLYLFGPGKLERARSELPSNGASEGGFQYVRGVQHSISSVMGFTDEGSIGHYPTSAGSLFRINNRGTSSAPTGLLSTTVPKTPDHGKLALLYTPANEHFGIVPVESMSSGLAVLACNSGGPTETVIGDRPAARTGLLRVPEAPVWAAALLEIAELATSESVALADRARTQAREHFRMEVTALKLERALVET
jgi:Glycosyl transferases group 1